jgi:hypothetical protein
MFESSRGYSQLCIMHASALAHSKGLSLKDAGTPGVKDDGIRKETGRDLEAVSL